MSRTGCFYGDAPPPRPPCLGPFEGMAGSAAARPWKASSTPSSSNSSITVDGRPGQRPGVTCSPPSKGYDNRQRIHSALGYGTLGQADRKRAKPPCPQNRRRADRQHC
jgi:hypothetical protein